MSLRPYMLMMVAAASLLLATGALAQTPPAPAPAPAATPAAQPAPTAVPTGCARYAGVSNRIVMCVRESLDDTTHRYFTDFYPLVKMAVGGFLTLTIIIYGILAAFGMLEKPARDVMILLVKMAFVTFFVSHSDVIYSEVLTAMDAAGGAVVEFTPLTSSDTAVNLSEVECLKNMKEASTDPDGNANYSAPWLGMDCVVDSVIGIKLPVGGYSTSKGDEKLAVNRKLDDTKKGLSRGLLNFFFSSFETSILGIMLGILGLYFVYTLVWLVLKALFVYLAGYLGIAFLIIFSPIFIPLVLFRVTKEYFNKWVKLIISFALQPIIILVFISFSIAAVDLAIFTGDYSVMYKLAGNASRQPNFNLNKYFDDHGITVKKPAVAAQVRTGRDSVGSIQKSIGGLFKGSSYIDCTQAAIDKSADTKAKCAQSYPIQLWRTAIDWSKLAEARDPPVEIPPAAADGTTVKPEQQIAREVFASMLFAAVVIYVMNALLTVVPMVANDLVGDSFQSPNLYSDVSRTSSSTFRKSASALSNRIGGLFGGQR